MTRRGWIWASVIAALLIAAGVAAWGVPSVIVADRARVLPGDASSFAEKDRTPIVVGGGQQIGVSPGWHVAPAVGVWPWDTWPAVWEPETAQELHSPDGVLAVTVAGHIGEWDGEWNDDWDGEVDPITEPLASGAVAHHVTTPPADQHAQSAQRLTAIVETSTGWVELHASAAAGLDPYRPSLALLLESIAPTE